MYKIEVLTILMEISYNIQTIFRERTSKYHKNELNTIKQNITYSPR